MASPLYTAPLVPAGGTFGSPCAVLVEFATINSDFVPALEFHAESVPSSVTKMKLDGAPFTRNPWLLLNTTPVGLAGVVWPLGVAIVTTRPDFVGAFVFGSTLYTVDVPVWLFATQNGPVGANATPHGLLRLGS